MAPQVVATGPAAVCGPWEHAAIAKLLSLTIEGEERQAAFLAARIKDAYGEAEKERANGPT